MKSFCGCHIDRLLHQQHSYIFITDAQASSNERKKGFTVYQIRLHENETKRRYSDFESLRNLLTRFYPVFIVPPIPEKHSLLDYAALTARAKKDSSTIEKRKRMLQTFLNQVSRHPYLGIDHLFHQFLDPDVIWADVLRSPYILAMLKHYQPLHMVIAHLSASPSLSSLSSTTSIVSATSSSSSVGCQWVYHPLLSHRIIPSPTSTHILKQADPFLISSEEKSTRLANFMHLHVEKSQRKVIRRLGELANDFAELGAVYNGFSLNELHHISSAIEKVGQTVDDGYTETSQMVVKLEGEFVEPMQSQTQMARLVKQVIQFQYLKQCQVELIEQALDRQQRELDRLLLMEKELQRLEQILQQPSIPTAPTNGEDISSFEVNGLPPQSSAHINFNTRRRSPPPSTSYASRMLNSVNHSIRHMIDVDPITTRRNQIGKSKECIQILEEALVICRNDFKLVSERLRKEIERFEDENVFMLRDILMAFATIHLRYCQKNLRSWQDAKHHVDQIPLDY